MSRFSINATVGIGKDYVSRRGKYKLTLPVKRAKIVKSYYIHQLIWLFVGAMFTGTSFVLPLYLGGEKRNGAFL